MSNNSTEATLQALSPPRGALEPCGLHFEEVVNVVSLLSSPARSLLMQTPVIAGNSLDVLYHTFESMPAMPPTFHHPESTDPSKVRSAGEPSLGFR